jgi:glycosyltransferase involved in cell wall biosynthesis
MVRSRLRIGIDGRLSTVGLGIATFVQELVRAVAPLVDVVWFGDPAFAPNGAAEIRPLGRWPYPLLDAGPGRRLARKALPDLMHFTGNTGWVRPGPVPFVLTIHDVLFMDSGLRRAPLRQVVGRRYAAANVRRAVKQAAAIATVSEASARAIQGRLGLTKPPLVIPHGVRLDQASGQPFAGDPFVLAFSGRDERKGVNLAVDAWRRLGDGAPKLYILAGGGLPAGLEQTIAPDREAGRMRVLPYVPREELVALMQAALALVYPSRAEGFGFPVLEGMAAGVPVITGLSPATLEIGGDAVLAIDAADPVTSIVAQLRALIEDPARRAELRDRGRERAAGYSWTAVGQRYVALYEQVVETTRIGEAA